VAVRSLHPQPLLPRVSRWARGQIVYWRWVNPLNHPERFCLHYVGQFFVGLPALPALIQGTLNYFGLGPILGGFDGGAAAET